MVKSLLKGMVWKLADSEVMPVRRVGWRLLGFFRRLTEKPVSSPSRVPGSVTVSVAADSLVYLKELYERCNNDSPLEIWYSPGNLTSESTNGANSSVDGVASKVRRIAILAPSLPKYDRSSSGLRVAQMVRILPHVADNLVFLYTAKTEFDPDFKRFLPDSIQYKYVAETAQEIADALMVSQPDILVVTDLFDLDFIALCSDLLDSLKVRIPACKVILDTMDCHWKKYVRKALVSNNNSDWCSGSSYLDAEREIYPKSDLLAVVTEGDGRDITTSIPGTPGYSVLHNCYELGRNIPDFGDTQGLCFVGAASVNHNLDAMRYFRDEIYPYLKNLVPECSINVIGTGWATVRKEFTDYPFRFLGHVADLDTTLSKSRVFVCPLTYGAGMKGKLGSAASAGIPVVTTSIGSEGYPVRDTQDFLVEDDPAEFAKACALLLTESDIWEDMRNNFRLMMESTYGSGSMETAVLRMIKNVQSIH